MAQFFSSLRLFLGSAVARCLPESRCFGLKRLIYRSCGVQVGAGTRICSSVVFGTPNVSIGRDSWIGPGTRIMMPAGTTLVIGDKVDIAMEVLIVGGSHDVAGAGRRAGRATRGDIIVGSGAWVCARSVVFHGVEVGSGAIVAAGSVVKGSVAANCVYAGNPARKLRELASHGADAV